MEGVRILRKTKISPFQYSSLAIVAQTGKVKPRHSGRGFTKFQTIYLSSSEEKYSFQSMSSTESSFISQSYCISGIEDW